NRLQKAGAPVYWLKTPVSADGEAFGPGAVWVPATGAARAIVGKSVGELGINAYAMGSAPRAEKIALRAPRIGIVDTYGGLITSGWMQWIVEQFEFPYTLVYGPELDAGNLNAKYDVLLFVDGAIPGGAGRYGGGFGRGLPKPDEVPEKYRKMLGNITQEKSLPQIEAFIKNGGTAVAVGGSTRLGEYLKLTENGLVGPGKDGKPEPLPSTKFYIPGSVLDAKVDNKDPLGFGFADHVDEAEAQRILVVDLGVEDRAWDVELGRGQRLGLAVLARAHQPVLSQLQIFTQPGRTADRDGRAAVLDEGLDLRQRLLLGDIAQHLSVLLGHLIGLGQAAAKAAAIAPGAARDRAIHEQQHVVLGVEVAGVEFGAVD